MFINLSRYLEFPSPEQLYLSQKAVTKIFYFSYLLHTSAPMPSKKHNTLYSVTEFRINNIHIQKQTELKHNSRK